MAIGADHHAAREGVLFEHHLVDDPRTGLPEADAVLVADALQEVEHLVALQQCVLQVLLGTHAGLDQVIAVHRAGNGHGLAAGGAELEQGHLGRCILHGHPVRCEIDVILPAVEGTLGLTVPQMGVKDLLGEGQRATDGLAGCGHTCGIAAVDRLDHVEVEDLAHAWITISRREGKS